MREDLSSGRASPFDLRAQPFWLLRIVPTSTRHEIEDAFEFAMRRQAASAEMLAHARDVLIDASLRLPYELAYPLGHPISELDEWHHLTSSDARSDELIKYAKRLSILSRFNFFAFVAAHRAADTKFLCAIIEAYSQIEPVEIYEELREIRRIGHYAAPSLASVREALEVQLDNYCQAIVAAYGQIEDLAEAIFGCVQQTLAKDDPHRMKVLSHLLAPYQSAVMAEQALMAEDISARALDGAPSSLDCVCA